VEAIQFRDAEAAILAYLTPYLGGVPAGTKLPETIPAKFLKVVRTGGPKETLISERAQITLEAYADRETDAINLLQLARAWLNRADGIIFGAVELSGPGNLPDPITAHTRYTMTVMVRLRGVVITGP
jgi:hypothetical protein